MRTGALHGLQPNAAGPPAIRREGSDKAECLRRGAQLGQSVEPRPRLGQRRPMTGRHPPQHRNRAARLVEPFGAAAQEARVLAAEHEGAQRLDILPHGHVDDHLRPERLLQRGRIAAVVLQPPDEARARVAQRVDPLQIGHELGHDRIIERRARAGDVELRQVPGIGHRCASSREGIASWRSAVHGGRRGPELRY